MPSPFPGMDPYLEAPDIWPGLHDALAVRDLHRAQRHLAARAIMPTRERAGAGDHRGAGRVGSGSSPTSWWSAARPLPRGPKAKRRGGRDPLPPRGLAPRRARGPDRADPPPLRGDPRPHPRPQADHADRDLEPLEQACGLRPRGIRDKAARGAPERRQPDRAGPAARRHTHPAGPEPQVDDRSIETDADLRRPGQPGVAPKCRPASLPVFPATCASHSRASRCR